MHKTKRERKLVFLVFLGSLLRAELKCHETLMVLKLEGWQRALTVARRAKELLSKVQKEIKSKESFRLTKSSYALGIHRTRESYQTPRERKFCKLSVSSVHSFPRKVRAKSTVTKPFDFMKRNGKERRKECQSMTESTFSPTL